MSELTPIGDVIAQVMRDALHAATHPSPHSPERALVPSLPSHAALHGAAGRPRDARGCDGAGVRDGAVSGVRSEGEEVTR